MEKSVFEVFLCVGKIKSEKCYRESQLAVIVSVVCALLNSFGGNLNIKFEDHPVLVESVGGVLRMIEQRLVDIFGFCIFNTKIKMSPNDVTTKQWVFIVGSSPSLCTVDYHFYLPTQTQVVPILPYESPENMQTILNRKVGNQQLRSSIEDFVLNKQVPFIENDSIQFKQLKSEKSKCVSLGDRMITKSNKLERYISGFANKDGGQLFYGIQGDGIVKGEVVGVKDQEEIIRKVTKSINQMIWSGGKLDRGKHWNIRFVSVKDENMKEISSLFVVIVSVAPLCDGLFTKQPESYHVIQSQVEKMSFTDWISKLFHGVILPSSIGRSQWSSERTLRIYHKVIQQLVNYQNEANYSAFEKFATLAKRRYADTDIAFIILAEEIVTAYIKGEFLKARSNLDKYEKRLSPSNTKDHAVLKFRAVYAKSAISRAKGNYQESYDIAKDGLQLAETIPAGILTAWFYSHVAIVEKRLSQQPKEKARKPVLVKSALFHFIKALQHARASSVEQEFPTTVAELQQRIHTFRAITLLGALGSEANFQEATPSDIKAAETDLIAYQCVAMKGYPVTSYHRVYYLLAMSDLRVCQWRQQQTAQKKRSTEDCETPNLLREAFDCATEAKVVSMKFNFQELMNYANKHLAFITEIMIKHKVSSLRPKWKNRQHSE